METDAQIQRDIIATLQWKRSAYAMHIGVGVRDGAVTLVGHVDTNLEKWNAERTAWDVSNVTAVFNELEVRSPVPCGGGNFNEAGPVLSVPTTTFLSAFETDFAAACRRRLGSMARSNAC